MALGDGGSTGGLGVPLTSQHALMSAAMIDAKRARIKVENDREALANRITRLQMEEVRATKRIEQTHRRTEEILAAKQRHSQQQTMKEMMRQEHDVLVEQHREALSKIREERKQTLQQVKQGAALERQTLVRANKESAARNAEAIAHGRAAELNNAMFKRNEVRRVEADARERKLREKELMIAHLQQRAEERQFEEVREAEQLDKQLADLEQQEYELLIALEGHKAERRAVHEQLESQLGQSSSTMLQADHAAAAATMAPLV